MTIGRPGRRIICHGYEGVALANLHKSTLDPIGENCCLTNLSEGLSANENPGALAGATGAETSQEDTKLPVCLSAHIAARHPILSLHWGIVA